MILDEVNISSSVTRIDTNETNISLQIGNKILLIIETNISDNLTIN